MPLKTDLASDKNPHRLSRKEPQASLNRSATGVDCTISTDFKYQGATAAVEALPAPRYTRRKALRIGLSMRRRKRELLSKLSSLRKTKGSERQRNAKVHELARERLL